MFRSKQPERRLKVGISGEDQRRKREELSVEIRKGKREESLIKKRATRAPPGSLSGVNEFSINDQAATDRERLQQQQQIQERLRTIPLLVEKVNSHDVHAQLDAVTQFRKLLSIERSPPIKEVISSGVIPKLVQFLQRADHPQLQFEAAWALTNVASGTTDDTKTVMDHDAVPVFVQLLRSPNEDVREQAVWALGNIAGDSAKYRDTVLAHGALDPLLDLCDPHRAKITMLRNATWTLSNFCRGKPQPKFESVCNALPVLTNIIKNTNDTEVLTDACWALSYLSDDSGSSNTKIQAVIEAGVAPRVVELLMHPSANVKTPALRTVGNIVTGDDMQTQQIISMGALTALHALLRDPKRGIKKEACWTISNITAGTTQQIQDVINADLIPQLVTILRNDDFDIKKEAAWAISNATSGGTAQQIQYLVHQGVIEPLCELLRCNDNKIIMVAMEGLENILKVGDAESKQLGRANLYSEVVEGCRGVDALEELQNHPLEAIYQKASSIIKTYIGIEDAGDDQLLDYQPPLVLDPSLPPHQQQQQHLQQQQQAAGQFAFNPNFQAAQPFGFGQAQPSPHQQPGPPGSAAQQQQLQQQLFQQQQMAMQQAQQQQMRQLSQGQQPRTAQPFQFS